MSRYLVDRVGVFGRNLARERRLRAKSPRTLALLADVSVSEIDRIEKGLRDPTVTTAARLADALGLLIDELIEDPARPRLRLRPFDVHDHADKFNESIVMDDPVSYQRFGETLRQERRRKGLTQDDMALAAGLGLRTVGEIEAGKPTAWLRTWLAIIEALDFKLAIVRRRDQSSP
jgi:HTH-type transcriptional regulator / antitoxin HipB